MASASTPLRQVERFSPAEKQRLAAWLSLEDKHHVELLRGEIVYKAMAKGPHGAAQGEVYGQIRHLQGPPGDEGGGWWLSQDVDVYLSGEGMRPDVAGWRTSKHPSPPPEVNVGDNLGVVVEPPDFVCEVLSKSTASRDLEGVKWWAYQKAGVEWYWLVDLERQSLTVYQRTRRSYEVVQRLHGEERGHLPPFEQVEFIGGRLYLYPLRGAGGGSQPGT